MSARPRSRGLQVSVATDRGRTAPGLATWLTRVAPRSAAGEVVVAVVSDATVRRLNRAYRRKDRATDVLSFPAPEVVPGFSRVYLGDIVIARGVARRQARERGHSLATELKILALHGLLHLLGYDHTRDTGQMARLERMLRKRGGLGEALSERAAPRHVVAAGRGKPEGRRAKRAKAVGVGPHRH